MDEPNVSQDLQFSPIESSIEKYKAVLASNKELLNVLNKMRENYIQELHDLLGPKVKEYLAFREMIGKRITEIRTIYRPTPEGEKIRSESERRLSAEAYEFNNSLGIDSSYIKNIQNKYLAQSRLAVEKALNITEAPYVHVTSTEIPKLTSMAGWTQKTPPYDSNWGSEVRAGSGGTRWMSHFQDKMTGQIECKSMMELYNASNAEYSFTDVYSELLIWFQMPTAGFIEAYITLYCNETSYSGCLRDEWGPSGAGIQQYSWCYLGTSQPQSGNRSFVPLLQYRRGEDAGCWSGNFLPPGSTMTLNLRYEHQRFEQGQMVLVAIGIRDWNHAGLNDMSFNTNMTSRWFLTNVYLRSAP